MFQRYVVHGAGFNEHTGDFAVVLQVLAESPDDAMARARRVLDVASMVVVLTDSRKADYEDVTDEEAWRDAVPEIRHWLEQTRPARIAELADEFRQDEASA